MVIYKRPKLFSFLLALETVDLIYFFSVFVMNTLSIKEGMFYPMAVAAGVPETVALGQSVLALVPGMILWMEIGMCVAGRAAGLWAARNGFAIQYDRRDLSRHPAWFLVQAHGVAFVGMMCVIEAFWHAMSGMLGFSVMFALFLIEAIELFLCRPALESYYSLRYGRLVARGDAEV